MVNTEGGGSVFDRLEAETNRRRLDELRRHDEARYWLGQAKEESGRTGRDLLYGERFGRSTESGNRDTTDRGVPRVCLSNRKTNCSLNEDSRETANNSQLISLDSRWLADRGVGIDRVSVSFPVEGFEADSGAWEVCEEVRGVDRADGVDVAVKRRWRSSVAVSETSRAFVGLNDEPEAHHRYWGKVEFNPSRIVDPGGWGVSGCSVALELIPEVINQAASLMTAVPDDRQWLVKRVDLARDFEGVRDVSFVVRGLGPVRRPWARRNLVHADPGRHGAQTLMVGSGAGVVRLYDKCAESQGRAPEGVLRWECESRGRWVMRYGGARTVADVGPMELRKLVENRWEWSAMGVGVSDDLGDVVERLEGVGLSEREQASYLGWLVRRGVGKPWVAASATEAKYKRIERQSGVSFSRLVEGSAGVTRRLDFDRGELVREVA